MRLAYLFAAFILGLLSAEPADSPTLPLLELAGTSLALGIVLHLPRTSVLSPLSMCCAAYFLGAIWMTALPTYPKLLIIEGLPVDRGCSVIGRAYSEAIETPSGKYLPLSLVAVTPEGYSMNCLGAHDQWRTARGIALIRVERDFVGIPGAEYRASGVLVRRPDRLQKPIFIRYRPRALIEPRPDGVSLIFMDKPRPLSEVANRFRYRLMSHLSWGLCDAEGQLVAGVTFGRRGRRLEGNWAGNFYKAGLSHLIVASGAQVSLLFMPVFFLLGRVRVPRIPKWLLLAALGTALVGFARLLGSEPSILRAAAMGCILLLSVGLGKQAFGRAALAAAGWFWLLQNPFLVRDTGFLLSLGASFGIIYFSPPLIEICVPEKVPFQTTRKWPSLRYLGGLAVLGLRKMLRFFTLCALITLSAQIGVFPVLATTIGRLSPLGMVANLYAVPLGQMVLFLGALSGLAGFVCPVFSVLINGTLDILASMLMTVAYDFAHLPGSNLAISPLPAWCAVAYYALGLVIVERWRSRHSQKSRSTRVLKNAETKNGRILDLDKPLPPSAI